MAGCKAARTEEAPESEQGLLKASEATPALNKPLQVLLLVLLQMLSVGGTYKLARKLFGATCRACRDRVQEEEELGQNWFHHYCTFNPLPLQCRFCKCLISGLPFWQSNGVAHYGCLDKKRAYSKMAQEETFKDLKWGFPDSKQRRKTLEASQEAIKEAIKCLILNIRPLRNV